MINLDPKTPHGHTAANARRDTRLLVSVTMRADQMSQMLPDGRGYSGPGPHEIQIYATDRKHLDALVDPATPAQLAEVAETTEARIAEWCAEHKTTRASCPINFPAEYRLRFRRDLMPVVSYKVVSEMDTIALEEERKRAAAISEATGAAQATQANAMAAGITKALIDAGFAPQQKATK